MDSSVAAVRPIESRSVVEQVMTELRRSILSGALAPGRELSLRELAEMLQVSIIPVREALRSLESEGLVVTRPGPAPTAPAVLEIPVEPLMVECLALRLPASLWFGERHKAVAELSDYHCEHVVKLVRRRQQPWLATIG